MVLIGETVIDDPVPTKVPPQEPLYQMNAPPVPREPPFTLKRVLCPLHIAAEETVIEPGAVEAVFTVTVKDAHAVVVGQGADPSALTK